MKHTHRYWLEKLQLQVVTAGAVAFVYLVCWQGLRGTDPDAAVSFLANGSGTEILLFAGILWAMAAVCGALTIMGRPESAMIAVLLGAGGLALRSGQMRSLLWQNMPDSGAMYGKLILEVVVLAVLAMAAGSLAAFTRALMSRSRPNWLWKHPLAELPDEDRRKLGLAEVDRVVFVGGLVDSAVLNMGMWLFRSLARRGSSKAGDKARNREMAVRTASALGLALMLSIVLLLVFMRSADRGQIIFALLASFFLAVLIAHQMMPCPFGPIVWMLPIVVAVGAYILAGTTSVGAGPQGWIAAPAYARALPLDWLTAGGGGATLGYWVSARMHEERHMERPIEAEGDQQYV